MPGLLQGAVADQEARSEALPGLQRRASCAQLSFESQMMFCPVCRSRSLREDKRKRFGLAIDIWWVCPGLLRRVRCGDRRPCQAGEVRERIRSALARSIWGRRFPVAAWQQLAPLSEAYWTCDRCAAQFYELGDSRLLLDWVEHDPHGVKEKLLGKTYYRTVWAKIANGLSAKVGNTFCPACNASFDYDQVDKKLKAA